MQVVIEHNTPAISVESDVCDLNLTQTPSNNVDVSFLNQSLSLVAEAPSNINIYNIKVLVENTSASTVITATTENNNITIISESPTINIATVGIQGPPGEFNAQDLWIFLITSWINPPELVGNLSSPEGDVYLYETSIGNVYRFVPTDYVASLDAFYSQFDGADLLDKIVSRDEV